MSKAIVQETHGGADVMKWRSKPVGIAGSGEVIIRHTAVGVNFIDIYMRNGAYPMALPGTPGMEGAGVVEAIGEGVHDIAVGQRVAYVLNTPGAYCQTRTVAAERLIPLPDDIEDETAAALMLKGMTAERLLHKTTRPIAGDTVLVQAAAGGVGLLLVAWAKAIGCRVIGVAGSPSKAATALAAGADHAIESTATDVAAQVAEITDGKGCSYVYDGVGKDTFDQSLSMLGKYGHLVSFGNASGAVPPVNIAILAPKCIALSRPQVFPYIAERADLLESAGRLFDAVRNGIVRADVRHRYPMADAADAHRDLEARRTSGQVVLLP